MAPRTTPAVTHEICKKLLCPGIETPTKKNMVEKNKIISKERFFTYCF